MFLLNIKENTPNTFVNKANPAVKGVLRDISKRRFLKSLWVEINTIDG